MTDISINLNNVNSVTYNGNPNIYRIDLLKNNVRRTVWRKPLVLATATANLERYVHSFDEERVYFPRNPRDRNRRLNYTKQTTIYRWRVASVTVNNAGVSYTNAYVNFTSNKDIYENPSYVAVIGSPAGDITAINLTGSKGSFAGSGSDYYDQSGDTHREQIGHIAPTVSILISTN